MRKLFIFVLSILQFSCTSEFWNQSSTNKSLNNTPSSAEEWNDLAESYREEEDTVNLLRCIEEAYRLAIEKGNNQEIGRSFMYRGDYERIKKSRFDSTYLDFKIKAVEYMKLHDNCPYLTEAYYDLSRYYNVSGKYDKAIEYLKLSLETITELNIRGPAPIYCDMAYSYLYLGNFDSLAVCAQKAIDEAIIRKDSVSQCIGYSYLGIKYSRKNNFAKSVEYHFKVADIYQQQQDWKRQVNTLSNILILYHNFEKYDKAIEIGKKCIEIVDKHNLPNLDRSKVLLNIAAPLRLDKQPVEAIHYYRQALPILVEQDHLRACLSGLAETYYDINELDSSNYYFDRLEDLYAYNNAMQSASYYNVKGRRAYFNKNYKESVHNWEKAIEQINKPFGFDLRETASFYNNLSVAYEKGTGNFEKALYYKNRALILQDSIFQDKYNNSLTEFYAQYQTAEKELEISRLNEEKQETRFKMSVILSICLLSVLALFFALLYSRMKRLRKEKETLLLTAKIREKEQENQAILKESELKQMRHYLDGLEVERNRLSKDLHDVVANKLYILDQNLKKITHIPESIFDWVEDLYTQIRNISHELISPSFQFTTLPEILFDFIEDVKENTDIQFHLDIKGEQHLLAALPMHISHEIYRIIQESVGNIIKHSSARNTWINLSYNGNEIVLEIKDDGIGFDGQKWSKGIGLQIIQNRCKSLQGKMEINSEKGKGFSIRIIFPFIIQPIVN